MLERKQGPLRAAMRRAAHLYQLGDLPEALAGLKLARANTPHDGAGLPSDEAAALAAGWEFQAAIDLCVGKLEAGLEDLAIAEQILDGRPEHNELRGLICVRIVSQLPDSLTHLRLVRAEYLASARTLLAGSQRYRKLLEALPWPGPMIPGPRLGTVGGASPVGLAPWPVTRRRCGRPRQQARRHGSS
jgi:hypothetical protein